MCLSKEGSVLAEVYEEVVFDRPTMWRFINDSNANWIFFFRYGDLKNRVVDPCPGRWNTKDSIWSRDILLVKDDLHCDYDLVLQSVKLVLGNGHSVSIWDHQWVGNVPLKEDFLNLFKAAVLKRGGGVAENGVSDVNSWSWRVEWRDFINEGDSDDASLLLEAIRTVEPGKGCADLWQWRWEPFHSFSVKSSYSFMM